MAMTCITCKHGCDAENCTKNQKALDALNKLTAYSPVSMEEMEEDALGEYVKLSDVENLIVAITTPPAPTVMGDDVRAIAEFFEKHGQVSLADVRTLIRAATQPPQDTDVNYLIRDLDIIRVILESSKDAVSADFQRIERLQDFIRKAAPAVPGEVMEKIKFMADGCLVPPDGGSPCIEDYLKTSREILALLGGEDKK